MEVLPITLFGFEKNLPTTPIELYQKFANTYDTHLVLHGNDNMYYWFGKACK
jgi:hypothetical protein